MSGANAARQGFARKQRILKASEFAAVYAGRRRVTDSFFAVNFMPNELGLARLGLSIGGKVVGNAVARNRVKRVIRDSFRRIAADLPALDLVVGARNGARTAHNARLRESLDGLWKLVQK
ncbi:MAG: ribonuclease P protein component [Pseudomonadota bacterium]